MGEYLRFLADDPVPRRHRHPGAPGWEGPRRLLRPHGPRAGGRVADRERVPLSSPVLRSGPNDRRLDDSQGRRRLREERRREAVRQADHHRGRRHPVPEDLPRQNRRRLRNLDRARRPRRRPVPRVRNPGLGDRRDHDRRAAVPVHLGSPRPPNPRPRLLRTHQRGLRPARRRGGDPPPPDSFAGAAPPADRPRAARFSREGMHVRPRPRRELPSPRSRRGTPRLVPRGLRRPQAQGGGGPVENAPVREVLRDLQRPGLPVLRRPVRDQGARCRERRR